MRSCKSVVFRAGGRAALNSYSLPWRWMHKMENGVKFWQNIGLIKVITRKNIKQWIMF